MRVLAIVHQPDAGPGVFADAAGGAGARLEQWPIAERREPPAEAAAFGAVMTFGGAMHVDETERHPWLDAERAFLHEALAGNVPTLAVCLGSQLLAQAAGGGARRARTPEIGWHRVELTAAGAEDPVLAPLAPGFEAFGWHSYEALAPGGATILARSDICAQAYRLGDTAWGIQFHAEVSAADALAWIRRYYVDEDAVRVGVDQRALSAETERKIAAWNGVGRALCARFLAAARARYSGVT